MAIPVSLGSAQNTGSASSIALTAGAAIQAGDFVIVAVSSANTAVTSVSDGTNTYTKAVDRQQSTVAYVSLWYCANCVAVASPTITANYSGAATNRVIGAARIAIGNGAFDVSATAGGAATNLTATTATLAQATEIAFGASCMNNTSGNAPGTGFTSLWSNLAGNTGVELDYQNTSSTAAVAYSPTFSAASQAAAIVATFKVSIANTIAATAGSFSITGRAATLGRIKYMVASAGTFVLSGSAALFKKAMKMAAVAGSYAITGRAATVAKHLSMIAASGVYAVTGRFASMPFIRQTIRKARPLLQRLRVVPPSLDQ